MAEQPIPLDRSPWRTVQRWLRVSFLLVKFRSQELDGESRDLRIGAWWCAVDKLASHVRNWFVFNMISVTKFVQFSGEEFYRTVFVDLVHVARILWQVRSGRPTPRRCDESLVLERFHSAGREALREPVRGNMDTNLPNLPRGNGQHIKHNQKPFHDLALSRPQARCSLREHAREESPKATEEAERARD